jgi:CCR4-NOT transcription complex subunit 2
MRATRKRRLVKKARQGYDEPDDDLTMPSSDPNDPGDSSGKNYAAALKGKNTSLAYDNETLSLDPSSVPTSPAPMLFSTTLSSTPVVAPSPKPKMLTLRRSEFPSLSNSSQLGSANAPSMWSTAAGSRAVSGPVPRNQPTPLSAAQSQEDMYPPAQARQNFRFGAQPQQGQQQQQQPPSNPPDEFPPLNRNGNGGGNGEIGGERSGNLMSSLGFNSQSAASQAAAAAAAAAVAAAPSSSRVAGNGLLNAISANNRSSDAPSASTSNPPGLGRPTDDQRKVGPLNADDSPSSQERRHVSGTLGSDGANGKATEGEADVNDPLAGMAPIDKFGIKGLQTMMANFPAYGALIQGMDPTDLGLNLSSPE